MELYFAFESSLKYFDIWQLVVLEYQPGQSFEKHVKFQQIAMPSLEQIEFETPPDSTWVQVECVEVTYCIF